MVPVGEGSGLIRWAMLSGMLMVRGEICGCTAFTGDSGASRFTFLPLDRAVKVILMLVLGNLKVHLEEETRVRVAQEDQDQEGLLEEPEELEEEPTPSCCLSRSRKGHMTVKALMVSTLIGAHIKAPDLASDASISVS